MLIADWFSQKTLRCILEYAQRDGDRDEMFKVLLYIPPCDLDTGVFSYCAIFHSASLSFVCFLAPDQIVNRICDCDQNICAPLHHV